MILLLVQMTHNSLQGSQRVGVSNPWTEYVKFLPSSFSLTTFWSEEEQELLRGTSLEAATEAKLNALKSEFEFLQQATEHISWCKNSWWSEGEGSITLDDWKYVDAAYRSRMLDLPGSGHSMVPCVDMVNHVAGPAVKALYDADSDGNAILQLRRTATLRAGEEVTITYVQLWVRKQKMNDRLIGISDSRYGDLKSASEMLFSYGFLDADMEETTQLTLSVEFPEDDPLGVAKKIICKDAPGIRVLSSQASKHSDLASSTGFGDSYWDSPLMWWLSVNEEDGLEIGVAQTTDGGRELEAKWKGTKIQSPSQLVYFIAADPLADIFQLRAVVLVLERLESQLSILRQTDQALEGLREKPTLLANIFRPEIFDLASRLRKFETALLEKTVEGLTQQVSNHFPKLEASPTFPWIHCYDLR